MIELNPNCSETVVRLKKSQIKKFNDLEKEIYEKLLDNWCYSETSSGDEYFDIRGNKWWKAHYYYRTGANELIAYAYWLGLEFDTYSWLSYDLIYKESDGKYVEIAEELSEWFTFFEEEKWQKTATEDERMAWKI